MPISLREQADICSMYVGVPFRPTVAYSKTGGEMGRDVRSLADVLACVPLSSLRGSEAP